MNLQRLNPRSRSGAITLAAIVVVLVGAPLAVARIAAPPGLHLPASAALVTAPTAAPATASPSPAPTSAPSADPTSVSAPGPPPPPRVRTQPLSFGWGVVEPDWPGSSQGLQTAESLAGRRATIIENYVHWGGGYGSFDDSRGFLNDTIQHGSVPMVTWMSDDASGSNTPAFDLRNIAAGGQDAYAKSWADGLRSLNTKVMLRLDSEMNGFWMPYDPGFKGDGTTAADFVNAWRHLHQIFVNEGAANVVWVWSPNEEYSGSLPLRPLYPGDAYVDVLAVDGYNWGATNGKRWQSFSAIFDHTISVVEGISSRPLMLGETGSSEVGGSKVAWINDMFDQIAYRGDIHGFIWFDITKETDWRIASSPTAAAAFARGLQADLPPGFQ